MVGWTLFVDETGHFDDGDRGAVAGLLVRMEVTQGTVDRWRRRLGVTFPLVTYPMHSTDLRIPATYVAAALRVGSHPSEPEQELVNVCARAVAAVKAATDTEIIAFRESVARGRKIVRKQLERCTEWLSLQRIRLRPIMDLEARHREDLANHTIAPLVRSLGPGGCCLIGAGRGYSTSYGEDDGAVAFTDGYLLRLAILFERVTGLLSFLPQEPHRVTVHVLERDIENRRYVLGQADVEEAVRVGGQNALPLRPDVTFDVRPIVPYDADVHPGLVFADFISNTMLGSLSQTYTWRSVQDHAANALRLPITLDRLRCVIPLPSIAAEGTAQNCIRTQATGNAVTPAGWLAPWAHEQMRRWLEAL
jgi:hypothetical protein